MTASDSGTLALHSCSTSSFHLERKSNLDIQPPRILHIGHGSDFWPVPETPSSTVIWTSPKAIGLTDVTNCYVSDLRGHDISTFKHPKNVQEIHFDGLISQANFDKLVTPLIKLKLLEIHISSLQHLSLTRRVGFLNYLPLAHLETLQISSHHFTPEHGANANMDKIINNCCILLTKFFPSLNFLAVSLPLVRHREDQITDSILKSLKIHRRTLKSLNVESTFEIQISQMSHVDEFTLPALPNLDLELTHLKEIQLHSFHYFSTYKTHGTTFWRKFLQTQRKLQYLQFWCGKKFFPLPTVLILHNHRNLHTIALNINPLIGTFQSVRKTAVDCTVFKDCALLKTLVLKAKPKSSGSETQIHRKSDLTNFHLIPKGLQHIRLIHLSLNKTDARIIAREMPYLSILYLEDIGEDHGLGLAMEDLAHLLGKKSLSTIDIHAGINKSSFNATSNEAAGGFEIVAKILFKTHNPQSFRAVIGLNGEYDIVDDTEYDEEEILREDEIFHQDQEEEDPFESNVDERMEAESASNQEDPFENWNHLKFSRPTSNNLINLPHRRHSINRLKTMKQYNHTHPTIYEGNEKLSGSSSSDEEILDFSPPMSSIGLKDAQTETDVEIHPPTFQY